MTRLKSVAHHGEQARDAGEQEDRRDGELDGVGATFRHWDRSGYGFLVEGRDKDECQRHMLGQAQAVEASFRKSAPIPPIGGVASRRTANSLRPGAAPDRSRRRARCSRGKPGGREQGESSPKSASVSARCARCSSRSKRRQRLPFRYSLPSSRGLELEQHAVGLQRRMQLTQHAGKNLPWNVEQHRRWRRCRRSGPAAERAPGNSARAPGSRCGRARASPSAPTLLQAGCAVTECREGHDVAPRSSSEVEQQLERWWCFYRLQKRGDVLAVYVVVAWRLPSSPASAARLARRDGRDEEVEVVRRPATMPKMCRF